MEIIMQKFTALMVAVLLTVLPAMSQAENRTVQVKETENLALDAAQARKKNVPILIMFSTTGCHYCALVESGFLRPMLISGDYDNKVLIRKIQLDDYSSIRDFDGNKKEIDQLGYRYNVTMVPTVVIVDHQGNMLSRMVGIANEYYYGGELDDAIDRSLKTLRSVAYRQ